MTAVSVPIRLRSALGSDVANIDIAALGLLVGIYEDEDLEVKSALYTSEDSQHRELALDVVALANLTGGLLVIGATEVAEVITKISLVEVPDGEILRMRQILNHLVVPYIDVDIHQIGTNEKSAIVISIPRSPLAPHAVRINDALRYVVRSGPGRRIMTESEIADRYRRRIEESNSRLARLSELIEGISRLNLKNAVAWLVLASVPEQAGALVLGHGSIGKFRIWLKEVAQRSLLMAPLNDGSQELTVGVRRLIATDYSGVHQGVVKDIHFEGHTDGSSAIAVPVGWLYNSSEPGVVPSAETRVPINNKHLVVEVLGALHLMGAHAARAGCAGYTSVLASIEVRGNDPAGNPWTMQLNHDRGFFGRDEIGRPRSEIERAAHSLPIGSIEVPGPELVSAGGLVANDLVAAFGLESQSQLTEDGAVRIKYFQSKTQSAVREWCKTNGIKVTDEPVPAE